MGKYKQWLHHQEVGARLRDEIAAHEAERERVLKLAPTKQTSLPDPSNPIIAALLGQLSLTKTSDPSAARGARNGTAAPEAAAPANTGQTTAEPAEAAPKMTDKLAPQASKPEAPAQAPVQQAPAQKESAPLKPAASAEAPAKQKAMTSPMKAVSGKSAPAPEPAPAGAQRAETPAQPDTIDPLLEQLLAQAESAPADPLEALNLLASQGPNLTRGDAPLPITTLPTAPLPEPASTGSSALSTLLGESKPAPEPPKRASEPVSGSVAVGVEAIAAAEVATRAEATVRVEKKRSDTDELVASRPTEGYTEPRLIVPQWLKSMELNQNQGGEKAEDQPEESDDKQRFSVSLPFESEEDMRLHESVERWWQRWRQQS